MGTGVSVLSIVVSVVNGMVKLDRCTSRSKLAPILIRKLESTATEIFHEKVCVNHTDTIRTATKSGVEGAHELPEGETLDGLLGVTTKDRLLQLQEKADETNLFCDETFPANNTSLFFTKKENRAATVNWLRPKDMAEEPQLIVDAVTKKDVVQGKIGDCWFLSALAAVASKPLLIKTIIPKNQVLHGEGYNGMVVFHFWRFGRWVTVCIDDQLPTTNGSLMFSHCKNNNEFWVPLVEKAYAKLHGSYEALSGGQPMDALVDLTGGLAECYKLTNDEQSESYKRLLRAHKHGAFITCSRKGEWSNVPKTQADDNGLVSGHSYTVTEVTTVPTTSGQYVNLIRIRNPWGDGTEWNGSWSDSSFRWKQVDENVKRNLEVEASPDGEFWMSYKDFCDEFTEVGICTLAPDSDGDGIGDGKNVLIVVRSAWELGKNCGGSRNNLLKFSKNPQFLLTISDEETYAEDEDIDLSGRRNVLISLMQEHRRSRKKFGLKYAHIGFAVYKAEDPPKRLSSEHFLTMTDMGTSGAHINYREVIGRFRFAPGKYVIIPSTFDADCPRPFLLRVYCDQKFRVRELKEESSSNESK